MAIIYCRECGNQISDKATMCPHCGYNYGTNVNSIGNIGIDDGSVVINSNSVQVKSKKDSIKIHISIDTILNTVFSALFIVFLFVDCFFEYYLVRVVIDYFDGYKTGSFRDLMWYGTDTDIYEFLIALIILPVVLILIVSWLKCFIFKFRKSTAFSFVNLAASVILAVLFALFTGIAKSGFYNVNEYHGRTFTGFSVGLYIEIVIILVFIGISVFGLVKSFFNKEMKDGVIQPTPVYQTNNMNIQKTNNHATVQPVVQNTESAIESTQTAEFGCIEQKEGENNA